MLLTDIRDQQEVEDTEYTGYDERCGDCRDAHSHTWNQHHRQVQSQRRKEPPT